MAVAHKIYSYIKIQLTMDINMMLYYFFSGLLFFYQL